MFKNSTIHLLGPMVLLAAVAAPSAIAAQDRVAAVGAWETIRADFGNVSLCDKHRITVMPILWDSCFGDAKASYDDVTDWVATTCSRPWWGRIVSGTSRDSFFRTVRREK